SHPAIAALKEHRSCVWHNTNAQKTSAAAVARLLQGGQSKWLGYQQRSYYKAVWGWRSLCELGIADAIHLGGSAEIPTQWIAVLFRSTWGPTMAHKKTA